MKHAVDLVLIYEAYVCAKLRQAPTFSLKVLKRNMSLNMSSIIQYAFLMF